MSEKYYYFGRLNIFGYQGTKEIFLERAFTSQYCHDDDKYKWGFLDIEKFPYNGRLIFFGHLVKYSPNDSENVFSEDEHKILDIQIKNRVIAESNFILDCKTGIIAYNDIQGKLGYIQFKTYFCKLIERSLNDVLVTAEIEFLNDEHTFFEQIFDLDKIETIKIYLHPSNPNNREIWKDTDIRLQKMEAEKYSQKFHSKKGLKIREDTKIIGDITMALDAYGSASVEGYKNDNKLMLSTGEKPMKQKGEIEGSKETILNSIWNKFQELFERMSR